MPTILVVDDVVPVRRILVLTLRREYTIIEAASGEEALALAALHQPDVAILDVAMSGIDGLEVCRRLRSDPTLAHIGVIIYSASSSAAAARRAGADRYVEKPCLPSRLRSIVQELIRARQAQPREDRTDRD
jgi:CheY-like chemotaxis protein